MAPDAAPDRRRSALVRRARPLARHTRLLALLAWLGAGAGGAGLVFAHLWRTDLESVRRAHVLASWAAFMVLTFQFHVALAALGAVALALATRRRRLAVFAGLVAAAGLLPAAWTHRPREIPAAATGDRLTVMSANLRYSRMDPRRLKAEIDAAGADVIVFQEYTDGAAAGLRAMLAEEFPHVIEQPRDDAFGQAVYSKRAFVAPPRSYPPGPVWDSPQILAVVEVGGKRVGVMNIHLYPPMNYSMIVEHRLQAAALAGVAAGDLASGRLDGLVLAGDFNATAQNAHLRAVRGAGLRDAFERAGSGRGATWPRDGMLRFVPGIRIDHVLASDGLVCLGARTCGDIGSDHRPIVATFGITGRGR